MENKYINEKTKLTFEQVGEFINSPSFAKILAQGTYSDNTNLTSFAGELMGLALDYVDVFGDCHASIQELEDILTSTTKKGKVDFAGICRKKVLRDLGLSNATELTPEQKQKVDHNVNCIMSCHWSQFHAYNGAFDDSIKKNGITANNNFLAESITELKELQIKYDSSSYIKADDGKVAFSETANPSYSYANTSPEWFSRMCGRAYLSRDYETAKAHVEKETNTRGYSEADKQKYIELFDQFWNTFAPQKNYLAIVPGKPIEETEQQLNQMALTQIYNSDSLEFLKGSINNKVTTTNGKTSETLTPTVFIEMPDARELCKSVTREQSKMLEDGLQK